VDEDIEKGVAVSQTAGNRIVMINIAVKDLESSGRFYEALLEVKLTKERHGDGPAHLDATFGEWNTDSWFLVALRPNLDRAGTADIGFLVGDLDAAYKRALAAGATDVHAPMDIPGMPRVAQVDDPSGNTIGLYQG
jgi:predicted enzyme related to lactoylglutathione lyase